MRKKVNLKIKNKKKIKINLCLTTLTLVFICTYFVIDFVGKNFSNKLIKYAEIEVGRIARYVVNYAVTTENIKNLKFNNLFIVGKNSNNEIQTVDFDPVVVNTVLNKITETVIEYFKAIEEGNLNIINLSDGFLINTEIDKLKQGIILEIPIGVITDNAILSNLGPKIPVKLSLVGEIESELETEVKYYGINNALITVYANIKVSEQIYMPIATGSIVINQKIPIAMKLIQGIVPNTYFGNLDNYSASNNIIK